MTGRVLVTGATGYIGSVLLRQLVEQGDAVRVVVRRPGLLPPELRGCVDVRTLEFRQGVELRAALEGVDTVFHLAACARAWVRDPREFVTVNVHGVRALLEAARAADVPRLVHVSTVLTLPPLGPAPAVGAGRRLTPYERTKLAGERLVEVYAAEGRHAVIVHPARVYGPGPLTDANAISRVVALYLGGRFRVRIADGDVRGSYVHVADVATGIRLAASRGRGGAHYLLGGENASFREFLDLVAELTGVRRRVVALPPLMALAAAGVAELWGKLGGTVPVTREWVRVFLEDRPGDVTPARRELGYAPRPLREGLAETIAWLQQREAGAA